MSDKQKKPKSFDKQTKELIDKLQRSMEKEARESLEEFKQFVINEGAYQKSKGGHQKGSSKLTRNPNLAVRKPKEPDIRPAFLQGIDPRCITMQIFSCNYIWGVPRDPSITMNVPPYDTTEVIGYSSADRESGTIGLLAETFPGDRTAQGFDGFSVRTSTAGLFIATVRVPYLPELGTIDISIPVRVRGLSLIWPGFTQEYGIGISQLTANILVVGARGGKKEFPFEPHGIPNQQGIPNLIRIDEDSEVGISLPVTANDLLGIGISFTLMVAVTTESNLTVLANYSPLRNPMNRGGGGICVPSALIRFCKAPLE